MEPDIHTGSLIYVDPDIDRWSLKVGDDITYTLASGTPATHRIIDVLNDEETGELRYRTQGIANENPDKNPVDPDTIIGMPKATVPYLGFLAVFIQSPSGIFVCIAVLAAILWLMIIPDMISPPEKKKKKKKDKNAEESPAEEPAEENKEENKEENSEDPAENDEENAEDAVNADESNVSEEEKKTEEVNKDDN